MTDQHALSRLHQRGSVSALKIGKPFPSIVLAACIAALSSIGMTTAQAKQQCSVAVPSDTHGQWWSYRLIDGRKCWYEGKPGLSKSLLEWPKETSEQPGSSREVTGDVTVTPGIRELRRGHEKSPLGRFGDWTITKKDSFHHASLRHGNLAVRCSDAIMTYLAFIKFLIPLDYWAP
jgi:hypothetical protein